MSDSLQAITSAATHAVRFLEEVATDCCEQYFWMTVAAGIVSLFNDQRVVWQGNYTDDTFCWVGVCFVSYDFVFLNAHI